MSVTRCPRKNDNLGSERPFPSKNVIGVFPVAVLWQLLNWFNVKSTEVLLIGLKHNLYFSAFAAGNNDVKWRKDLL